MSTRGWSISARAGVVPYRDLLEELLDLTESDAQTLDCVEEVNHTRRIVERGTSAHRQVAVYEEAVAAGADTAEALRSVVDFLIAETVRDL